MTATSVVCPECKSPVAPGRLSCQSCGTLLASVVGSSRRFSDSPAIDPMLPDVDEDKPIASARQSVPEAALDDAPALAPSPIVVEADAAVAPTPPSEPAKRAPRRLPRPRSSTPPPPPAPTDADAQTSIFGPLPSSAPPSAAPPSAAPPSAAPPILHSWADPIAEVTGRVATVSPPIAPATRTVRPAKSAQRAGPSVNGNGSIGASTTTMLATQAAVLSPPEPSPILPAAIGGSRTNGVAASSASVAGAYLAPSATYASAVVDRPAPPPSSKAQATNPRATASVAPTWPGQLPLTATAGTTSAAGPGSVSTPAATAVSVDGATARRMSDWLVIGGASLAIFSFVLPWATDGVIGSSGTGYSSTWGLANLGHLLLILAAAAVLVVHLVDSPIPHWIRSGVLPIAVGGLLSGLAFAYYARPFGGGAGVAVLLAGGVLLVAGGVAASRPERNEASASTV